MKKKQIKQTAGTPLQSLPNIGKVSAAKLQQIGITSAEEFLARNPYQVFHELLENVDPTLCRCALASIVGAALNKPWHEITKMTAKEFDILYPMHTWGGKKC